MSITPDETADPINDALVKFTGCMAAAVEDMCSYGLTIGDTYVPFDPDPEDGCDSEESFCSQLWVRVTGVSMTNLTDGFGNSPCGGTFSLGLEVGVLRCIEVPEDGEAPTATDVLAAAMQSMTDMKNIQCAAMSCGSSDEDPEDGVWDQITVGEWTPIGPLGGQYGGSWTFTVELT